MIMIIMFLPQYRSCLLRGGLGSSGRFTSFRRTDRPTANPEPQTRRHSDSAAFLLDAWTLVAMCQLMGMQVSGYYVPVSSTSS